MPKLDADQLNKLIREQFPHHDPETHATVEEASDEGLRMRVPLQKRNLRPGNTLSGPTLMTAADTAVYLALLSQLGPVNAATADLSIHFLKRPNAADVIAKARLLRLGRRQVVGEVELYTEGDEEMVAHATVAFAISGGG